ncbi:MAG: hypothetical protein ACLQF4_05965 [Xanthobacteraceae bacterium]
MKPISRDAIGEIQPRFGDKEKTRFVGEHGGSFRQIKTRGSQSPILEFQTHFRTQSTFGDWKNRKLSLRKRQGAWAVPHQRQYQLGRARKILSEDELVANRGLRRL